MPSPHLPAEFWPCGQQKNAYHCSNKPSTYAALFLTWINNASDIALRTNGGPGKPLYKKLSPLPGYGVGIALKLNCRSQIREKIARYRINNEKREYSKYKSISSGNYFNIYVE